MGARRAERRGDLVSLRAQSIPQQTYVTELTGEKGKVVGEVGTLKSLKINERDTLRGRKMRRKPQGSAQSVPQPCPAPPPPSPQQSVTSVPSESLISISGAKAEDLIQDTAADAIRACRSRDSTTRSPWPRSLPGCAVRPVTLSARWISGRHGMMHRHSGRKDRAQRDG